MSTASRPYDSATTSGLTGYLQKNIWLVAGLVLVSVVGLFVWLGTRGSVSNTGYTYTGSLISARDPVYGKTGSAVSLVMLKDYICPACKANQPDVNTVYETYKDRVQFVVKPVDVHQGTTQVIARAALAAGKQGKVKEFSTLAYERQEEMKLKRDVVIDEIAKQISLDLKRFNDDRLFDSTTENVLNFNEQDVKNTVFQGGFTSQQASSDTVGTRTKEKGVGIQSTPTIAIVKNGVVVSWWEGAQSAPVINQRLEAVLATL